ncbi:MAG: DNA alkylation repair protein [Steroidobacter sp.]
MPAKKKSARVRLVEKKAPRKAATVATVLKLLERRGAKATRDGMARYGIVAPKAFGVTMGAMKQIAKGIGPNHTLALALWATEWYEARMLATLIDDPLQVTSAQMDQWCRDFDNWAICDTACFALFDRTPHAWRKVESWSRHQGEFQKRAAFALLACLALHRKDADDAAFMKLLPLIDHAASDERNFVRKGASWALRAVGERSPALNAAAAAMARRLAASSDATERWLGKDALRELTSAKVAKRTARRDEKRKAPAVAG